MLIIDPIYKEIESVITQEDFEIISDVNEKNIEMALGNLLKDLNLKVKVICSPNYDKFLSKEYKMVLKIVKEILSVKKFI